MRKAVLAAVLAVLSVGAANAACSINYIANETAKTLIKQRTFQFDRYDVVCARLQRAHASLHINGEGIVLSNRSIGWATVELSDPDTYITSMAFSQSSTRTSENASQNVADDLEYEAIMRAVNNLPLDNAIAELDKLRKSARH